MFGDDKVEDENQNLEILAKAAVDLSKIVVTRTTAALRAESGNRGNSSKGKGQGKTG